MDDMKLWIRLLSTTKQADKNDEDCVLFLSSKTQEEGVHVEDESLVVDMLNWIRVRQGRMF